MRPFAGAVFLVHSVSSAEKLSRPARDLNGYSVPLRMALYTARLAGHQLSKSLEIDSLVDILYLLSLSAQLLKDQIDLQEDCHLFASAADPDVMTELQEFLSICNSGFNHIFSGAKNWVSESEELDQPLG